MLDRDRWHEILSVLGRNKWRTFLTAFGVFWGIFMLVIMLGSAKGLANGTVASFGASATNSVFMWTQQTSMPYKGFKKGRFFQMTLDDVEAIKENVSSVGIIAPRCQSGGYRGANNVTHGVNVGAFGVYGDVPDYILIDPVEIVEGRFINQRDLDEKTKVCVIGVEVYNRLFTEGEPALGSYIKIQGVNFKVVGLFKSIMDDARRSEEQEKSISVPISTFQQAFNWGNNIGWLSITSAPKVPATKMEKQVQALLKERHSIHPEDERAFGGFNKEEMFNNFRTLNTGISMLSLIVGVLTLLAGAIGVSNIMVVTVKERTREFGIRRAVGATPWAIISQVMMEALTLTLMAGVFGVIGGVWLLEAVNSAMNSFSAEGGFFRNPGVDLGIVITAMLILIFAGLLAGLIPARRAVEVRPVEALRYE